jgi:hypothetical protein
MPIPTRYKRILFILLFALPLMAYAQGTVSLTGPTCVIPGPVYVYYITGPWDSASTVRVCVSAGMLVDSGSNCAGGGGILSFVRVVWDSSAQGSIAVTSSVGNISLSVNITRPLSGGQVGSAVAWQTLDTLTTPATLTVSVPTGGACQPAYVYQWQQSTDNLTWVNIAGATSAQFSFSGPVNYNSYFRRVVTDNAANVMAYSNVAVVFVNRPMPALFNPPTTQP